MGVCSKLKVSHDGEIDRISNLPDSIITHILSLLPFKYAVLTSVLSSRWKHHWTTIDSFDFDDRILCHLTQANDNPGGFMVFFERVLQQCDVANIRKFRLSWHQSMDVYCLRAFISFAVSRNVQELELDIQFRQVVELPQEFFVCKSLKKLKVRVDYLFYVPLLMDYFPSLKSLHVQFMYPDHPNLNFCQKLLCRCPQLEELFIDVRPYYRKDMLYKISSTTIKRLRLMVRTKSNHGNKHMFKIAAPVLENLYIVDDTSELSLLGSFPQLKTVVVDLRSIEIYERTLYQLDRAVQILSGVANTEHLSLSLAATIALANMLLLELPSFHNLTCLEVTIHDFLVRQLLFYFLRASNNLQVLILQMENKDGIRKYSQPLNWTPCDLEDIPLCLLQQLKVIRIKSFRGLYVETNVIKFLLWHCKVLQKMTIHTLEPNVKDKFSKKILKLPRASNICDIEIV